MCIASLIRGPELHANNLFWCRRHVAAAGAHTGAGMGVIVLSMYILVKVFRVEAKPDLFAFWGFFDVTHDQLYPVSWLIHSSDYIVCDHFVKFLFVQG